MKKTKLAAKRLTLKVWRYLRDHPEIRRKQYLPEKLYRKIRFLNYICPLCELFEATQFDHKFCFNCPLDICYLHGSSHSRWSEATNIYSRKEAAAEVVRKVESWKIKKNI